MLSFFLFFSSFASDDDDHSDDGDEDAARITIGSRKLSCQEKRSRVEFIA